MRGVSPAGASSGPLLMSPEHRALFHQLNNQLGIVLAHAELLETTASNEQQRARAAQIVASVLDALRTSRELQRQVESHKFD